jgi:2-(1,2-epoxy-1,2-dihydrophenyl)acetyl-CoA isomerase
VAEESLIKPQLQDGILILAFNRPQAMNAMTQALVNRLRHAIRDAARDPDVRVVILTGEGRAFCAGGDIKNLGQPDAADPLAVRMAADPRWKGFEMYMDRLNEAAAANHLLRTMPKPTIAMVNGPSVGGGMAPALACDFRILSDQAWFNTGYVDIGLSGDAGTAYFLTCVVGPARARELMMLPRKIDATEALRLGLANRVVPHAALVEETMALARTLAGGPSLALGHIKENLNAAQSLDAREAFDVEARNFARCFQTEDHREAVAAFKEKRRPSFRGR